MNIRLSALVFALALCLSAFEANAQQTKEQCRDCCSKLGLDEYYTEQCKLRCFRNPESCARSRRSAEQAAPKPVPEPQASEKRIPPAPPQRPPGQAMRPPVQPGPAQPGPPPPQRERPRKKTEFTFPNPLDLTAGREWEAAAQIAGINGIGPGHPNHQQAVRAVEQLLVNFARNNPQGGKLPVTELQKIIGAFR